MPMKKPPHPGNLIRTEVIEVLGLSVSKAAQIASAARHIVRFFEWQGRADAGDGPAD
jgi:plasmid maintenance system antidote protein VapI